VDWIQDRLDDLTNLGSGGWLAIAAWAALALGVIVLLYANRQIKRSRALKTEQIRPQVTMYMEPHASDWHVIELVVKNFGSTAAHDIALEFINPPTVAAYEDVDYDGPPDVAELDLPSELTYLAPGQEWRTVWDSSISREELGGNIRSRFDGTLSYFDRPRPEREKSRMWNKRQEFETKVTLDWSTLQPASRLDLMTSHDLAKREKQKLELLRTVLTYFHYASKESRPEVFRAEIDRMNRMIKEVQDRTRTTQLDQTTELEFPWIKNGIAPTPAPLGASGRHRDPA
jgi:hypothetical protein